MPLTSAWLSRSSTVPLAPGVLARLRLCPACLTGLGEFDQPLGGVGPAVEQHVLHELEQVLGDLLVNRQHAGVDDAHVQAGLDGVVEKGACIASRTTLLPRNEKETLLMPPLTCARGQVAALIQRVASMKSTA